MLFMKMFFRPQWNPHQPTNQSWMLTTMWLLHFKRLIRTSRTVNSERQHQPLSLRIEMQREVIISSQSLIIVKKPIKLNTNDDRNVYITIFLNASNEQDKAYNHVQIN